jgi:hypothetical protein
MRALLTVLAASTLLASSATAAPIATDAPQRATAQQMVDAEGTYRLSDGRHADIFVLDNRLYVKIGRSERKELVLTGPNRFASPDGSLSIRFDADLDSDRIVLEHDRGIGQLDTIRLAVNQRASRGSID